jgi:hypothetical protein
MNGSVHLLIYYFFAIKVNHSVKYACLNLVQIISTVISLFCKTLNHNYPLGD